MTTETPRQHPRPMTLCDTCQAQSDRWLDYRLPTKMKIASGAAYDDTVRGVADARAARLTEWRNTIRFQQSLIRRICEEQHRPAKTSSDGKDRRDHQRGELAVVLDFPDAHHPDLTLWAVRLDEPTDAGATPIVTATEFRRWITAWTNHDPLPWHPTVTEADGALIYRIHHDDKPHRTGPAAEITAHHLRLITKRSWRTCLPATGTFTVCGLDTHGTPLYRITGWPFTHRPPPTAAA